MSPPIFTPDGSEVTEIVLPDGSTASQVIGPDGNVVFEAGPDIPDSGISRWTFDNADTENSNPLDVWGDNDGTNNGATTGVSGANQTYDTGEAYSFDPTNGDYVEFPHDDRFSAGDSNNDGQPLSIALWVYWNSVSPTQELIAKDDYNNQRDWNIGIFDDGMLRFFVKGDNQIDQEFSISSGSWTHYVFVYDGGLTEDAITIYKDGAEASSSPSNSSGGSISNVENSTQPVRLGDVAGQTDRYLDGDVDDPRFYSKALSSTEVSDLYNNGSI